MSKMENNLVFIITTEDIRDKKLVEHKNNSVAFLESYEEQAKRILNQPRRRYIAQ